MKMRIRRGSFFLPAVFFVLSMGAAVFAQGHDHSSAAGHPAVDGSPKKTGSAKASKAAADEKVPGTILTGEVLDLSCYLGHGGQGKDHKKCAKMCLLDGAPAGLLTDDGAVVLFVENHDKKKEFKSLANYAGDKVKATGTLINKSGLRALVLDKLEPAK